MANLQLGAKPIDKFLLIDRAPLINYWHTYLHLSQPSRLFRRTHSFTEIDAGIGIDRFIVFIHSNINIKFRHFYKILDIH